MKIVIVSDLHANLAAIEALPEHDYDQLWCVGDLVDYGPRPREVIQWVNQHAGVVVRGNHDHAVGFDVDPQCSLPFRKLAADTRRFTQFICSRADVAYLKNLPVQHEVAVAGQRFYIVHAVPTDPLFGYCAEASDRWVKEVEWIDDDVLVVGHTHTPFVRTIGKTMVINPGSLGQPKTGRSAACYAIWQDGKVSLKEYSYPMAETIRQIRKMPIPKEDQEELITVLETGTLCSERQIHTIAAGT